MNYTAELRHDILVSCMCFKFLTLFHQPQARSFQVTVLFFIEFATYTIGRTIKAVLFIFATRFFCYIALKLEKKEKILFNKTSSTPHKRTFKMTYSCITGNSHVKEIYFSGSRTWYFSFIVVAVNEFTLICLR